MRCDLANLLRNSANAIREFQQCVPHDGADARAVLAFGLDEAAKHIDMVTKEPDRLREFAKHYCIVDRG